MSKFASGLSVYRALTREVKRSGAPLPPPAAAHVRSQFRAHRVTEKQHCKAEEEMKHLADAFAAYLRSQRRWLAVMQEYHAKGERSVEETARIVGFKLPHDPK